MPKQVKAITPAEAYRPDDDAADEIESRVKRLNRSLRGLEAGQRTAVAADLIGSGTVRAAVVQRFRQAGWKLEYVSDQRDGDFYWFSA